jgi:uncharacterized protein (TIGR02996 family)
MSEETAFLDALATDPADDVTRLVYADWLEERGDERGDYLRGEIEFAALEEFHPRRDELALTLASLRERIDVAWLARAGKRFDVVLFGYEYSRKIAVIKSIITLIGCKLRQGKDLVERLPSCLAAAQPLAEAEAFRAGMQEAAGNVEVFPTAYDRPEYATLLSHVDEEYDASLLEAFLGVKRETAWPRSELDYHPVRLQETVTFAQADLTRKVSGQGAHVILQRLPAGACLPQGVPSLSLSGQFFDLFLDGWRVEKRDAVVRVLSLVLGCSPDEAEARLEQPTVMLLSRKCYFSALSVSRAFRGVADLRLVRCD